MKTRQEQQQTLLWEWKGTTHTEFPKDLAEQDQDLCGSPKGNTLQMP